MSKTEDFRVMSTKETPNHIQLGHPQPHGPLAATTPSQLPGPLGWLLCAVASTRGDRLGRNLDRTAKGLAKGAGKEKQWKDEYEEVEQPYQQHYKKGMDYNVGAGDYGDYYNSTIKNKYQGQVSGTASYSRHDYSSSSAPRKQFQSKW